MTTTALFPDISAPPAVKKKRAPKHDFKDGRGKVFAHRHDNGGGWVADTAFVAPSVRVTRNAQVYHNAKVYDCCRIEGRAQVYGSARLFDEAWLQQDVKVHGYALVRQRCQLSGRAQVHTAAMLLGDTRLMGRVVIGGSSIVKNSTLRTYRNTESIRVLGDSMVIGATMWDYVLIADASVCGGSIANAHVQARSQFKDAQIYGMLSGEASRWLYDGIGLGGLATEFPNPPANFFPLYAGAHVYNSALRLPGVLINENCSFLGCDIELRSCPPTFFEPDERRYYLRTRANNIDDLVNPRNISVAAPHNPALSAIPSTGSVPLLEPGARRRIIRLGDD